MPISVPKGFKDELLNAAKRAKNGAYLAVGAGAVRETYNFISGHLKSQNIPHKIHNDTSTVPPDHVYWKP